MGCAFFCGWFLTLLMFHALSGNGEGESALSRIRKDSSLHIEQVGKALLKEEQTRGKAVYLTGKNTELCRPALTRQHFFGREEEMFELRKMMTSGGKYLISGMGGIGKTELMRQLLKYCEDETPVDYICVIQYEGRLQDSFVQAFPGIRGTNMEENFYEALARIRMHEREWVLIIIDNMNRNREEELTVLKTLRATIFVTSRYQEFRGFTTYAVLPPGQKAAGLIFRDNYSGQMDKKDFQILSDLLKKDIWRHTLTLRLLGRIATDRGWTMPQLREHLENGISYDSAQKQETYGGLRQMYRRIYADFRLEGELKGLLRIFSVLPYRNYTLKFAERFLSGFSAPASDIRESLKKLYEMGWLEKREEGYSMHPFIAECVRSDGVREKDITPFLEKLASAWEQSGRGFKLENVFFMHLKCEEKWQDFDPELKDAMILLPGMCLNLDGEYSCFLTDLALLAFEIRYISYGCSKEEQERLMQMRKRSQLDIREKAAFCVLLCEHKYGGLEEMKEEYRFLAESPKLGSGEKAAMAYRLALAFYESGDLEETEKILDELKRNERETYVDAFACQLQALVVLQRGDYAGAEKWFEKSYETGKRDGIELGETLFQLAHLYILFQQFEQAERVLREIAARIGGRGGMQKSSEYLFYCGSLAMNRGDAGYGIEQLEEACRLARIFWSGAADLQYVAYIEELATAYNKAGRREEAARCHRKALDIYRQQQGYDRERHLILNNMSVMYLDMGKPQEALTYLEEGLSIAEQMGGLGLAESENNLSKAWRQLGDREKELEYLKKAAPVLEQFYGSEHPKVVDAKKRLAESENPCDACGQKRQNGEQNSQEEPALLNGKTADDIMAVSSGSR